MKPQLQLELALLVLVALVISSSAAAQGCFSYTGESRSLSVSAAGVNVEVTLNYYEPQPLASEEASCLARATVLLSSFPSSRLATRPADLASAIRDVASELGAKECVIMVWYTNDTEEDRAGHERCVKGSFRYDEDSYWSSSSETSCWSTA